MAALSGLLGILTWLPAQFAAFIFVFWATLSNALSLASSGVLAYVTSPSFYLNQSKYGYIRGDLVQVGLAVTQGFVNIVLVLFLVFIALAIILQIKDYEAKKILPLFIVVALLVNFAPVFCGLVIDASNIVMNYFLIQNNGYQALSNFGQQAVTAGMSTAGITFPGMFSTTTQIENLSFLILLIITNFATALILLIFAVIFIVRHFAIWLLVIFSPLAFALYILPITRNIFQKWLSQFVGWCFVGITCSFFLYLGSYFSTIGIERAGWQSAEATIPLIAATIFLYIGLTFGLKTSAIGARAIIGYMTTKGKGIGKRAASYIGGKAKSYGKDKWGLAKEKILPERVRRAGQRITKSRRLGAVSNWGKEEKGWGGWTKRAVVKGLETLTAPEYYARQKIGKGLGADIEDTQKTEIKKLQEEFKGKSITTKASNYNRATTDKEKAAILNASVEDKEFDKVIKEANISNKEINRLIKQLKKWNAEKTIIKANPQLANDKNLIVKDPINDRILSGAGDIDKAVKDMKPKDYGENLSKSSFDDLSNKAVKATLDAMAKNITSEGLKKAYEVHGNDIIDAIKERLLSEAKASFKLSAMAGAMGKPESDPEVIKRSIEAQLQDWNPRIRKFIDSPAGQIMFNL